MKKAAMVVSNSFFEKNRLFDLSDSVSNRDNCLLPFYLLKESLKQKDVDLATSDIHSIDTSEIVIYNEMPKQLPRVEDHHKSYLLLFESELIRPDNWNIEKHQCFSKIFTWHDDFVDNKKYFKINFSHEMPKEINKSMHREKLCTMIAGNKAVKHPLELYSKRVEVIRWLEKEHPNDFDLYGMGWDEYCFSWNIFLKALNRVKPLKRLFAENYPSYQGRVKNKKETLEQYKFSICFENARDIPGYITEKIFDCFFAGCVPVYWGANNISDHIPERCFIDMRNFSDYDDMYKYMKSMSDNEYLNYLHAIDDFIHSNQAKQFTADFFAKTIIGQVVK